MKSTNIPLLSVLLAILCAVALPITAAREEKAPITEIKETAPTETTAGKETQTQPQAPIVIFWEDIPLEAELQDYIVCKCRDAGINPAVIFAIIFRESSYRTDIIGDNGNSFGLMQVQPRWHSERMARLNCTDLLDPYDNVTVGIDYLQELLDRYDGDITKALVAYNRGSYSGTITEYAEAVLNEAERLNTYVLN